MARAVARRTGGLLAALAVGLLSGPRLSPAGAQSARLPASPGAQITLPATTLARTTTTIRATTTTPPTVAATTTPTTATPTTTAPPRVSTPTVAPTVAPTTDVPTTTPSTVASIPAPAPAPVTLPLASASQSGSIGAIFPILGGIGLFSLLALLTAQWFLTKPGRRGPTL